MQTFTLGLGVWVHRLLARNPLVRRSDRVETFAILLTVVAAVLTIPLAGAIGTAVHGDLVQKFATHRAERTTVQAVAMHDSVAAGQVADQSFRTQIRWEFGGSVHTGTVRTVELAAGAPVTIWIDDDGDRVPAPLTDEDAASQAVVTAVTIWITVVGVAVGGWALLRYRLDRARYADWDRGLDDLTGGGRTNHNA